MMRDVRVPLDLRTSGWALLTVAIICGAAICGIETAHAQVTTLQASASTDVAPTTVAAPTAPVAVETSPAPEPEERLAWDLLHRRYNTWTGATGGLFLMDARPAEPGAVRVQLGLGAYSGSNYLATGDHIDVSDQTLSLSGTATENLEFYASLSNRSSSQTRPGSLTLDALGDISVGARVGGNLSKVIAVGGDVRATLLNKIGGAGFDWGATGVALRTALSFDLQELPRPVPFVARFNVGYVFDNSAVTLKDTENERYAALTDPAAKGDETRNLATRFERLAMGINRVDHFAFGVGVEVPLQVAQRFYLHPMVEWQLGLPVNRQNYDCPFTSKNPQAGSNKSSEDGCYERSPNVVPMDLGFGVRVVPPVRGLSATIGADIGLTGTSKFVRELAPNLPYRVLFAISYDYDARPTQPSALLVERPLPVGPVPVIVAQARVQGIAIGVDGKPIEDARVRFLDRQLTALATGPDGRFTSEPLPAGPVSLEITHPDFEPGHCAASIGESAGDVDLRCTLAAKPVFGKVQGQVLETTGAPIASARITLSGPTNATVVADPRGNFSAENLQPGAYTLHVDASGYFGRQGTVQVEPRGTGLFNASLLRRPIAPSIQLRGESIDAPSLHFIGESNELDASSAGAVAEIADLLLVRTDLYLQIVGFGASPMSRSLALKQRLLEAGVPESHVEAVGGGTKATKLVLLLHR
jgi:hypothetical protein